jgi:hypothetical protein
MEIARHSDPTLGICAAWLFPPPMFLKAGQDFNKIAGAMAIIELPF